MTGRSGRSFQIERLEDRYLLSASTGQLDAASLFDMGVMLDNPTASSALAESSGTAPATYQIGIIPPPPQDIATEQALANGAAAPAPPFPLDQTFLLNSFPSATKTIYLDFDGFTTRNTPWNADFQANIVTIPYDFDSNFVGFSDAELTAIQKIWERVSEDYRPFQVNVTTQDPGIEALSNSGGLDDTWGVRVAIGGSTYDWFTTGGGGAAGGVAHLNSFTSSIDDPVFVFAGDFGNKPSQIAEAVSHEVGHSLGLLHDGQTRYWLDTENDEIKAVHLEYYPGHPTPALNPTATTNWAPIMGVAYGKYLTQWSQGEYPNATNVEDDLAIITTQNGFDYRDDDHGNTIAEATPTVVDPLTADLDTSTITAEGIIERNTDVDYFSFVVEGVGELVSFDIEPFSEGPNLDILAKLYNSSGTVIATSNDIDTISASFTDMGLLPGTYYISIEGDGRPITYIDPIAHPGPVPDDESVPDNSDWGYSKYGSLGAYTITGTRKKALVVGVDFDMAGGATPAHWTLYSGGTSPTTLTNLKSEAGQSVPYQLTISSTGSSINTVDSTSAILGSDVPQHGVPLDDLRGYLTTTSDTLTFEWSNLQPATVYQIYVFGHASTTIQNHVTVVGGEWNGVSQVYDFLQNVDTNGMVVGDNAAGHEELSNYSLLVISDLSGKISITVSGSNGLAAGIAGLAIAPTKVGSISGQKWNDANGNSTHDGSETGLSGWTIYLDLNNDGQLNKTAPANITVPAPNVPQALQDYSIVKNEMIVAQAGQITDVNVTLDISHTFDADVNVFLVSPAGTRVKLFGDIGGSGDNFLNTVLDDEALYQIGSQFTSPPFTGSFRPQNPLSTFDGENSAGKWTLEVQDDATGDTGVLNGWSLTFSLAGLALEPFQVTDANGDYTFTDLPAGQYYVRESATAEQIQEGWKPTLVPTPVTVRSGADVTGVDFGNWIPTTQRGSIQGEKFNDVNGNGVKDNGETGLEGWTIYLDANGNGVRDVATSPTLIAATGLPKPITDFSTVNSSVVYSGLGTVFNIEVTLDITHSFVGDLDAYLISPSGRQVELFTQVGGQYNDLTNLTLSDSAARSISTLGIDDLPYTGTWRPEGLLSDFNGDNANGTWTLQIRDTAFADQGTLNSWTLKITSGEVFRTTDADGKYSFADLPAGSYNVGEENQAGWSQVAPANTSITAATWSNSQWHVSVSSVDNPSDPIPDSNRNVKNVDFGNQQAAVTLAGDYDRSNVVDASDYVLWRKKLGTTVASPFDGADGNGNGTVDAADHDVWRAHFGDATPPGAGSLVLAASGSLDAFDANLLLSSETGAQDATLADSSSLLIDLQPEATSTPVFTSRPAYRPATIAANSSDQALLAWLVESEVDQGTAMDGTTIDQPTSDAESVDIAFESLEAVMLGDDGVV